MIDKLDDDRWIDAVAQAIPPAAGDSAMPDAARQAYARALYDRVAREEVAELGAEDLAGAALALLAFAAQRPAGEPRVRVYNPTVEEDGWQSGHTVLEVVNDDMPFLVDSVSGALQEAALGIHAVLHPVVWVRRDPDGTLQALLPEGPAAAAAAAAADRDGMVRESHMQVQFDQHLDPEMLVQVRQRVEGVLADVRRAVEDWPAMKQRLGEVLQDLKENPPPLPQDELEEIEAFLAWVRDDHFTFLEYREADVVTEGDALLLRAVPESRLGVRRPADPGSSEGSGRLLTPAMRRFAASAEILLVTKYDQRSTVHRPVHMDYIGIKKLDAQGRAVGEHRFLGLFTSTAYSKNPRNIPLLRKKVRRTLESAGLASNSHDGKALAHILESFPRDELFQTSEEQLLEISLGILQLGERQRVGLFLREDPFERFVSCLVYCPRDRFTTDLRLRFVEILEAAFDGQVTAYYVQVVDAPLARIHFIVKTEPGQLPPYDRVQIEQRLAQVARNWSDRVRDLLAEKRGEQAALALMRRYEEAFPVAYREAFPPAEALFDIDRIERLVGGEDTDSDAVAEPPDGQPSPEPRDPEDLGMYLYRSEGSEARQLKFKVYSVGRRPALSKVLPRLEDMGLKVEAEIPYEVRVPLRGNPREAIGEESTEKLPVESVWIGDFDLVTADGRGIDVEAARNDFHDTFRQAWQRRIESDSFNRLVLAAGITCRQVVVLRALCKYLQQVGIAFSQRYMASTLAKNPELARLLVDLFLTRFDPDAQPDPSDLSKLSDPEGATPRVEALRAAIHEGLERVTNLDEDRIVRRYRNLIDAIVRTNYFQTARDGGEKDTLSFKIDCGAVEDLPAPRPRFEIFVYSPRFEAIHLRGGLVARGGLRWSDRREDFRTEVLGLMKAQMVKNAVIVPVGSKGGFVVKRPSSDRDTFLAQGQDCYRDMIRGLLDLTDNLVDGAVQPPDRVVRHDGIDDTYLVVAADKGTATFSDLANQVSAEYGFWLGDAFASGGSQGYDHKKMGITARGAWESVRRHFRELGVDIQQQRFTAVGVGDMSGDVFGNGMLQSPHTQLVGAFNHLHIFVDPDPNPAKSFAERQRLFALPRSSWADYDRGALSAGGAIYERQAKALQLSPEIRQRLGIEAESVPPNTLIRALLTAEVDLLWFGGIGTYVKHSSERDGEIGDRANDGIRVAGRELRCRVVGEGANLGLTQQGRIEFALVGGRAAERAEGTKGGKLNTDFIDNSGGVDCSDHEVNIKILLARAVAAGRLDPAARNRLLGEMTDEVAELVLRDNYLQSQAISIEEARGPALMHHQARTLRRLEQTIRLNRALEFLPDEEAMRERQKEGLGLTRPEIAVLLAYAKMALYEDILASDLPDDPLLVDDLVRYFPTPLRQGHREDLEAHRLRREIIATTTTNSMVNRVGPTFVVRMEAETGRKASDIARAYTVARDAFNLRDLWAHIEKLDDQGVADLQLEMIQEAAQLVERATLWLLRNGRWPLDITRAVGELGAGARDLEQGLEEILTPELRAGLQSRIRAFEDRGAPPVLARHVGSLPHLSSVCDLVRIADGAHEVWRVGRIYYAAGDRFGLDPLRRQALGLSVESRWEKEAIAALVEDLFGQQRDLTGRILEDEGAQEGAVERWIEARPGPFARVHELLEEVLESPTPDLAMLTVATHQLRRLVVGG